MPNQEFQVLYQMPRTKYDAIRRENIEGFDITYQDRQTGTQDVIFVPSEHHAPEQVTALIMAKLQRIRAIADL